jgi:hypothetical protein
MKSSETGFLILALGLGLSTSRMISPQTAPVAAQTAQTASPSSAPARSPYAESKAINFEDHTGFVRIFDGKTLKDWDGNPEVWHVDDGSIVGVSTRERPAGNTFIVYHGSEPKDFDLKLEINVEYGGGSGIQYRSTLGMPPPRGTGGGPTRPGEPQPPPPQARWTMFGPQADFWYPVNPIHASYTGQLYSQNTGRRIIAWRGEVVNCVLGQPPVRVGNIGDRTALGAYVKDGEWNQYTIMVRGGTFIHILNGQLMAVLVDDDPASSNNADGLIGLQIEGVPSKVSFRNIWLKKIN